MTKREQQRIETRKKIYDIALDLFLEKGFDKVSVQMIVKKANLSIGAFYHHFASKEALIDEGYRDFDKQLEKEYQTSNPKAGKEAIYFLIHNQNEACFDMGVELTSVFFKNQIGIKHDYMFDTNRFLVKKLEENIECINTSFSSTDEIVLQLLRVTRGTIYDWCLHNGDFDLNKQALVCVDMCLKYYGIE